MIFSFIISKYYIFANLYKIVQKFCGAFSHGKGKKNPPEENLEGKLLFLILILRTEYVVIDIREYRVTFLSLDKPFGVNRILTH